MRDLMAPRERVRRVLRRRGPQSMDEIAEALALPLATVRPIVWALSRDRQVQRKQTFELVREPQK